ncbi:hypothetical protein AbraIFM66950_006657 [Aspergillus brasiliensis]|nr:hypothetical protein AbraIFM66950_006657 [Aspergillus brasiliensis]
MVQWAATLKTFLWALFICQALAFPFEPFRTETDVVPSANVSDLLPRHLVKRASRYPGVRYGSTCSATQQAYLDTELDEIEEVMRDATRQLRRIRAVIREKEQPATWGTRYAENTRILNSWNTMIGTIKYTKRTNKDHIDGARVPLSWRTTERNMQTVLSLYNRIFRALQEQTLSITIHCNDDFYVLDEAATTKENRIYRDTRPAGEAGPAFMKAPGYGALCHDSELGYGWQMWNEITQQDEICICPTVFNRVGSSRTLSTLENSMDSLRGMNIDNLKKYAAAGTLLHELTHCRSIVGNDATDDVKFTPEKVPAPEETAYERSGIWRLAVFEPRDGYHNAGWPDSVTYFALALHYWACDWSMGTCAGVNKPYDYFATRFRYTPLRLPATDLNPPMASLNHLPLELLLWIAGYLTTQRDISHLMQATKHLYHLLSPFLYEYNVRHDESSALPWAAQKGEARLVSKLLAAGANIAAYVPSPRYVERKVKKGRDIDPWAKKNPLLCAAQGGHTEILKALLGEARSGQRASPAQLRSVLHLALRQHDEQLVELMLAHHAPLDPATKSHGAPSALGVAMAADYTAILSRLLALGACPEPEESPCPTERAICNNHPDIVRLFLDRGWGLNSDEGLCHIAHKDDRAMLQLLLEYGLDLRACSPLPLFTAIRDGQYDMAELLIDNGMPKDLTCELYPRSGWPWGSEYSAVGFAILYERLDILRLLLDKEFLPQARDLELARERDFVEAVSLLKPFAERELPVHMSIGNRLLWGFDYDLYNDRPRDTGMWKMGCHAQGIVDTSGTRVPDPEDPLQGRVITGPTFEDSDGDYSSELDEEFRKNGPFNVIWVS